MISVCCTRHPAPTAKNNIHHKHLLQRTVLGCCVRESFVLTRKRQHPTKKASDQQHSSKTATAKSSRGGGDLASPAIVYVPENQIQTNGKTNQPIQNINHFPKLRSHYGRPIFLMQLFLRASQLEKIVDRKIALKCSHNSRSWVHLYRSTRLPSCCSTPVPRFHSAPKTCRTTGGFACERIK